MGAELQCKSEQSYTCNSVAFSHQNLPGIVWIIILYYDHLRMCFSVSCYPYALMRFPYFPLKVPLLCSTKGSLVSLEMFPDRLWSGVWVPCVAVVAVTSPASPVQPPPDWFYIQPRPAQPSRATVQLTISISIIYQDTPPKRGPGPRLDTWTRDTWCTI